MLLLFMFCVITLPEILSVVWLFSNEMLYSNCSLKMVCSFNKLKCVEYITDSLSGLQNLTSYYGQNFIQWISITFLI